MTPRAVWTLRKELRDGGYDVVHVHEPIAPVLGWDVLTSSALPLVGTFHCYSTNRLTNGLGNLAGASRRFNRLGVRIAVSDAAAWTGERFFGGRYRVIPNGVEVSPVLERADFELPSAARPLRAARDGIRASSWRLDPTQEASPDETVLRLLVHEQAFASGQRADGRFLVPEIYLDADELVIRIFISPRQGFQTNSRNPETPVRVALPEPVGTRRVIDGALVHFSARPAPPAAA